MRAPRSNAVYDYEAPEPTLKTLLGPAVTVADIFTGDKIDACQWLIDRARATFFDSTVPDMDRIATIIRNNAYSGDYRELCRRLFRPLSNIKGQAELLGFSLIAHTCGCLNLYGEAAQLSAQDVQIIGKLLATLRREFEGNSASARS